MKICVAVFAFALMILLSVDCQQTQQPSAVDVVPLPTYDQLHCILDTSRDQSLNLVQDCAGNTLFDVSFIGSISFSNFTVCFFQFSALCNQRACYNRFSRIYEECNYTDGFAISK